MRYDGTAASSRACTTFLDASGFAGKLVAVLWMGFGGREEKDSLGIGG